MQAIKINELKIQEGAYSLQTIIGMIVNTIRPSILPSVCIKYIVTLRI